MGPAWPKSCAVKLKYVFLSLMYSPLLLQVKLVLDSRLKAASIVTEHLPDLAQLTRLTHLTFGLSKGAFKAATTGHQIQQLSSLRRLQQLCIAADHKLQLSGTQLQGLASCWGQLQQLALLNVDFPDGLEGLQGFSRLGILSLWLSQPQGSGGVSGGHQQLLGLGDLVHSLPELHDVRLHSKTLSLEQLLELQQHGEQRKFKHS